ncbi:hypothetical protein ACFONL_11455 [Camelimonas fluminis]|uniref:DUF1631 family protein n=2 Tax=Camelimonas fluminis TaxID=1576911 RepID=A0ABV7UH12_9HYPH|nr:hypothetical protein [Camelimonas fluminis]
MPSTAGVEQGPALAGPVRQASPGLSGGGQQEDRATLSAARRLHKAWVRLVSEGRSAEFIRGRIQPLMKDEYIGVIVGMEDGGDLLALLGIAQSADVPAREREVGAATITGPSEATTSSVVSPASEVSPEALAPVVSQGQVDSERGLQGVRDLVPALADLAERPAVAPVPRSVAEGAEARTARDVAELAMVEKPVLVDGMHGVAGETVNEPVEVVDPDAEDLARFRELLGAAALPHQDLVAAFQERGRGFPEALEIEFVVRSVGQYFPSGRTQRSTLNLISHMLGKESSDDFDDSDVSILRGLVGRTTDESLKLNNFPDREAVFRRVLLLLFDDLVARRSEHIAEHAKNGFTSEGSINRAKAALWFNEQLAAAFPDMKGLCADYVNQIHRASYDLSVNDTGGDIMLQDRALGVGLPNSERARNLGVSRLLASTLPPLAQEALVRFIGLGKLIEEMQRLIGLESVQDSSTFEKHVLYPSVMLLQHRALREIRDLKASLVRHPSLLGELPEIVKNRDESLAALFDQVCRQEADIVKFATAQSDLAGENDKLGNKVSALEADLEVCRGKIGDLERNTREMQDLVSYSVKSTAEQDRRFVPVGDYFVKAEAAGEEVAIAFVHGLGREWSLKDGYVLEAEGGPFRVDLLALHSEARDKDGLGERPVTRIRVVIVEGKLGMMRGGAVFLFDEFSADPGKVLQAAAIDELTMNPRRESEQ